MLKRKAPRKTDYRNPVSHQLTEAIVMKVSNDRSRHRPDYVPDAAENKLGVFAHLEDDELSDAEKARMARGADARGAGGAGRKAGRARRIWSPREVRRYTLMLYKKLKPATEPKSVSKSGPKSGGKR